MKRIKMNFNLVDSREEYVVGALNIIGQEPNCEPYISIELKDGETHGFVRDRDRVLLARNILKALNLNPGKNSTIPPK